ncbi:MAG: hypothetical protein RL329_245 [Bacteroidota bacterium]|jgi:predicted O-methyltransferase YrrM
MNHLKILWRFFKFYCRAKTKYNIHSPYVYGLAEALAEDNRLFYVFEEAEILREVLLKKAEQIPVADYGAGSLVNNQKERSIQSIAASALSSASECRRLFRIAHWCKPNNVLEMGTSLGISALYLAEGAAPAQVVTLEGAPAIAAVARENFNWFYDQSRYKSFRKITAKTSGHLNYFKPNTTIPIEVVEGRFENTLPKVLKQLKTIDLAFIDGNHRAEPTLQYFEMCLAHAHEKTVLIFDDIHWSEDMEKAWEAIRNHPKVTLSIDLFWCGMVFFRQESREKEHFDLIEWRYKPFSLGFFKT